MPFGTDLWDQWQEVEEYVMEGVHSMHSINEFMKARAAIEADYAKSLLRLVKPYKDDLARKSSDKKISPVTKAVLDSSTVSAWAQVLIETENVANNHNSIAEKLDIELRKSVKYQANDNEKKIKEMFDEIRKANAELQKQVTTLDKLREKFETDRRNMELANINYDKIFKNPKSTEKEIETAKMDADKKALAATDAMEAYQQYLTETNDKKNRHFQQFIPNILNEAQTNNENFYIRATRTALIKYYELYSSAVPSISDGLDSMNVSFQKISAEADSEVFIANLTTGDPFPPDYWFEEKAVAKDLLAKRPAIVRTQSRAQVDKGVEREDDESIINLPPKKSRKLTAERLKLIERDITELEKKRTAVDMLLEAYGHRATKDPKNLEELATQRSNYDIRLDNLGLRRHKLLSHIAGIDKQPAPEMPQHLVGKSMKILPAPVTTSPPTLYLPTIPSSSSPSSDEPTSSTSPLAADSAKKATTPTQTTATTGTPLNAVPSGSDGNVAGGKEAMKAWNEQPTGLICKAKMLYDFEAAPGSQEISVAAGDILDIYEQQDDGWWRGRVFTHGEWKEGYVPGNYTQVI